MGEAQLDARKGTPLWGVNMLRQDALTGLLDDLVLREKTGFPREYCDQVKLALEKLVNSASTIPDGSWCRRSMWQELQKFAERYQHWNFPEGLGPECEANRRKQLMKLRKRRNVIATKMRKKQYILQKELDLKVVHAMYDALAQLPKQFPEVFKELGKAVTRYFKTTTLASQ